MKEKRKSYPANLKLEAINYIIDRRLREIAVTPNDAKYCMTSLHSQKFKLEYPNAIHNFKASANAWMDEKLMVDWLEVVWQQSPGGEEKRSLLVFDSYEGHLTSSVKNKCYETNTVLGVILGGLISINDILAEIIIKSFEKYGISNVLENQLAESNNVEEIEGYDIVLESENKENEKIVATTSTRNTDKNYIIRINEHEVMSVALY
ncbi:15591_t:CDS:2 [Racocetra fulgida]|uniref:15591_t:CDS:1 n=1 Tax=Racocetra fulgida TaxID=60492 RepID=A0A9N8W969_9GLOM|nr:15591_t:CDS:2 [Racocetra fulgida]